MVDLPASPAKRDVDTVPFVEMHRGRIQGVVSSDSDIERVYCAFLESETGNFYSSTNNNRPDAGMLKRIRYMMEEAIAQFGESKVAHYLKVKTAPTQPRGRQKAEPASEVFSRFLNYLQIMERQADAVPVPEMSWFNC